VDGSERHERARDYWVRRVPQLPPAPGLPLATSPSAVDRPRFSRRMYRLDARLWSTLRERAAGRGLTVSMVLAAAYARVLGAWSADERFTLNVTVNSRPPVHPQVGEVVGDFTELTLLEAGPAAGGTGAGDAAGPCFADRARGLQRQMSRDLDHREFTGIQVMREITRQHDPGTAVMPVIFTTLVG